TPGKRAAREVVSPAYEPVNDEEPRTISVRGSSSLAVLRLLTTTRYAVVGYFFASPVSGPTLSVPTFASSAQFWASVHASLALISASAAASLAASAASPVALPKSPPASVMDSSASAAASFALPVASSVFAPASPAL